MAHRSVLTPRILFLSASVCMTVALSGCDLANRSQNGLQALQSTSAKARTEAARRDALERARVQVANSGDEASAPTRVAKIPDDKRFQPNTGRMIASETTGKPGSFKKPVEVAIAEPKKTDKVVLKKSSRPTIADSRPVFSGPLSGFHTKLAGLRDGTRTEPVTIVHIGDSHVASDSFSRSIRRDLQAEFGHSGRGAVIPAGAFKYGVADQVSLSSRGGWRSQTALKNKSGEFGLSGVQVSATSRSAILKKKSGYGSFDYAEAMVVTGPGQGDFIMSVDGKSERFSARAAKKGAKLFRINASGNELELRPAGNGRITVLHWSTGRLKAGIRYVNFGLIGATVDITRRFDRDLVAAEMSALDPDLIVYGYGTNEGFNDNLNLATYRKTMENYLDLLTKAAPGAETVIIGPADGLRRRARGGKACGGGWYQPKKMVPLRDLLEDIAQDRKAGFWDWSKTMGGTCSANRWAGKGLAAGDRVHLTSKGYQVSGKAFAKWLAGPTTDQVNVALNAN